MQWLHCVYVDTQRSDWPCSSTAWPHVRSSHWRGTVGWTLAIKGLCSLPNIDLLCCYMGSGIICKQYQPWYRGLLLFFLSLAELPAPAILPPHCFLLNLMHVFPCCPYATSLPPVAPVPCLGPDHRSLIVYVDQIHMSFLILWLLGFFAQYPESTSMKWQFSLQSLVLGQYRHLSSCVIWWHACSYSNMCMCKKIVIPALGVQQAFVGFLLLSLACHCYSRGFPLWAAVLIADGVVLAKYLVTVLRGWKMWEWGEAKGAPLLFYLI